MSDTRGNFIIGDVSPGNWRIEASRDGYIPITVNDVVVSDTDLVGVNLVFEERGLQIKGWILIDDRPVANAKVSFILYSGTKRVGD